MITYMYIVISDIMIKPFYVNGSEAPNSCKMILSTGSDISYLTCLTTSITMFHIYVQYRCIIVIQCRHLTGTLFIKFSFNTEDSFS